MDLPDFTTGRGARASRARRCGVPQPAATPVVAVRPRPHLRPFFILKKTSRPSRRRRFLCACLRFPPLFRGRSSVQQRKFPLPASRVARPIPTLALLIANWASSNTRAPDSPPEKKKGFLPSTSSRSAARTIHHPRRPARCCGLHAEPAFRIGKRPRHLKPHVPGYLPLHKRKTPTRSESYALPCLKRHSRFRRKQSRLLGWFNH